MNHLIDLFISRWTSSLHVRPRVKTATALTAARRQTVSFTPSTSSLWLFVSNSDNWSFSCFVVSDSSSSKRSLVSSLDCLSSIVERISTDPAVAPLGDSVVPRGPGSPQSSPAGSSSSSEPNSIYEPLWTRRGLFPQEDELVKTFCPLKFQRRRLVLTDFCCRYDHWGPCSTSVNKSTHTCRH